MNLYVQSMHKLMLMLVFIFIFFFSCNDSTNIQLKSNSNLPAPDTLDITIKPLLSLTLAQLAVALNDTNLRLNEQEINRLLDSTKFKMSSLLEEDYKQTRGDRLFNTKKDSTFNAQIATQKNIENILTTTFDSIGYKSMISNIKDTMLSNYLLSKWTNKMMVRKRENGYYTTFHPSTLKDIFYKKSYPALQQYLLLIEKYEMQPAAYKQYLMITPIEVADRIVALEELIIQNPTFFYAEDSKQLLQLYVYYLTSAVAFDPTTQRLQSEYYEAWQWVHSEHNGSQFHGLLARFDALLRPVSYVLPPNYTTISDSLVAAYTGSLIIH